MISSKWCMTVLLIFMYSGIHIQAQRNSGCTFTSWSSCSRTGVKSRERTCGNSIMKEWLDCEPLEEFVSTITDLPQQQQLQPRLEQSVPSVPSRPPPPPPMSDCATTSWSICSSGRQTRSVTCGSFPAISTIEVRDCNAEQPGQIGQPTSPDLPQQPQVQSPSGQIGQPSSNLPQQQTAPFPLEDLVPCWPNEKAPKQGKACLCNSERCHDDNFCIGITCRPLENVCDDMTMAPINACKCTSYSIEACLYPNRCHTGSCIPPFQDKK